MKKIKLYLSLFMVAILMFTMTNSASAIAIGNTSLESAKIKQISDNSEKIIITDEGIYSGETFYTKEEFLSLLEQAVYLEGPTNVNGSDNDLSTFSLTGTLIAGTWYIPVIGEVVITTAGVIIVGGAIIAAGSWIYNTVSTYFAEKAYEKAKENGTKTDDHSTKESTSGDSSLSTTGTPLSSKDLKDSQGVKQRRYYDKNGNADLDIDYRHAGNYKFPHRHTWTNGVRSGH